MLLVLGGICFFFLMAGQFPAHEYYFVDTFYPSLIVFLILINYCFRYIEPQYKNGILIVCTILIGTCIIKAKPLNEYKFVSKEKSDLFLLNKDLFGGEQMLDSLGIDQSKTLLFLDACSNNLPQLRLNRYAYTVIDTKKDNLINGLEQNMDYVIAPNRTFLSSVYFKYPEICKHLNLIHTNGKISLFEQNLINNQADIKLIISNDYQIISDSTDIKWTSKTNEWASIKTKKSNEFPWSIEKTYAPFEFDLKSVVIHCKLNDIDPALQKNYQWVLSIQNSKNKIIHYEGLSFNNKHSNYNAHEFIIPKDLDIDGELKTKVYIWNNKASELNIDFIEIYTKIRN